MGFAGVFVAMTGASWVRMVGVATGGRLRVRLTARGGYGLATGVGLACVVGVTYEDTGIGIGGRSDGAETYVI